MKIFSLSAMAASMMLLAGCQSTTSPTPIAQKTSHPSQGVYQVEFAGAHTFSNQADKLANLMAVYCADQTKLPSLKSQWHQTMMAWMALQGQERGPEKALEQSWNIQFWPDKKNTTGRKMAALTGQDQAWTQEQISQQSVTVQGLGSVEWLLYDQASSLSSSHTACQTGIAITENIALNAQSIAMAWQTNPWVELDEKAWTSEYISLLSNQLEYSMKKLSRPLANFGKPRPYFAESWRSETSMLNLKANIVRMQALYLAEGDGLDALLRKRGKVQLADSITQQFDTALVTWPTDESLFDMLQTKEGYRKTYAQYNKLEQLKYLIHEEVAIELGVVIGFNATDGD
ncbi:imelysin family protein [Vibrio neptunius]|uniref:Iron-regulated protein A n=1 Tax=Vibrio neptunius TaxID=170651 RepID=A0ABS3A710_9VIBR|nr:imelysin family protein [Vibrio neptunius]MBN3495416.1 iron-regulated protein A [Vibrio neptunius]MBN3517918.1 iron-regulated protein A [Vibrio neptunius]MBN3552259.1 iron-regulated protein A [Vibrio neptunius]MBN3580262.1 iron-regulated protein A [Vibrio neptunius]MCH9873928.1 iron-regulated protein A [Vibrio neptunius]